ncbi:hypothetical protein [Flavobacterium cerinum]|uniref:Uncharacterized protein n=1 Tax=Flavobacterium cerinum TaxID=2502784 RepID=A0A3S3QSS5_9FLAO|nr:hypothetical protein [Flavobacterium cerinum]RWX00949.1 hypothetical protein EPI11_07970 [Flavobacterium cerinum]
MEQILNQLEELQLVLQYSSEHATLEISLTVGERIMVNQERAALFRALDGIKTDFTQSVTIITKINRMLYLIERTDWKPKIYNYGS